MERVGGHEPVHVDVASWRPPIAIWPPWWPRAIPRGSLVSRRRISHPPAAASRAAGRHPAPGAAFCRTGSRAVRVARSLLDGRGHPLVDLVCLAGKCARVGSGDRSRGNSGQRQAFGRGPGPGATERPPAVGRATQPPQPSPPAATEILSLDAAMKKHIEGVLAVTHGRIEGRRGAAAVLKINPHTLRARMRKLGIDWAKYRIDDEDY